jgi:hypothetical protein
VAEDGDEQAGSDSKRWAGDHVAVLAAQMRSYRGALRWSAADLANRCAELGHPIPTNVLQKIEGGVRRYVTTAEWIVIAGALDVPPLALLVDLSQLPGTAEPLPGQAMDTATALSWLRGDETLPEMQDEPEPPAWLRWDRWLYWIAAVNGIERHDALVSAATKQFPGEDTHNERIRAELVAKAERALDRLRVAGVEIEESPSG